MQPRTVAAQIARFNQMLDLCARNGWHHLAALVQKQLDELMGK